MSDAGVDLTRMRLSYADYDAPWLECVVPACGWSSENDGEMPVGVTVGGLVVIAERHLDTHRAREAAAPPALTGAHPFDMCICVKCGPPFRDQDPNWATRRPFLSSWMALCPTCGSKRCPGAFDHANHPADGGPRVTARPTEDPA